MDAGVVVGAHHQQADVVRADLLRDHHVRRARQAFDPWREAGGLQLGVRPGEVAVVYTRWQILLYTVLLLVATILPWAVGMSGLFYLGGALVLGVVFLWYAWKLLDPPDELFAMRVFNYSIVYLMALFAFLLVDHWLLPWLQPAPGFELRRLA